SHEELPEAAHYDAYRPQRRSAGLGVSHNSEYDHRRQRGHDREGLFARDADLSELPSRTPYRLYLLAIGGGIWVRGRLPRAGVVSHVVLARVVYCADRQRPGRFAHRHRMYHAAGVPCLRQHVDYHWHPSSDRHSAAVLQLRRHFLPHHHDVHWSYFECKRAQ